MILYLKDECIPFDPAQRLGIYLVYECAIEVSCQNALGLNIMIIRA